MLEKLFPDQPDHPGITHYIIHSYDVPALAIARSTPRGATRRSRRPRRTRCTCRRTRSPASAPGRSRSTPTSRPATAAQGEGAAAEELHAMDYLVYAYLQTGQDREARRMLDAVPEVAVGGGKPGNAP